VRKLRKWKSFRTLAPTTAAKKRNNGKVQLQLNTLFVCKNKVFFFIFSKLYFWESHERE
jgi:hypothetical protein